jgi:cob(I)alamin adenosyltransferase
VPRITKVYTRTGDDGSTGLGTGRRVPKTAPRIVAFGVVDELNAHVGVALAAQPAAEIAAVLRRVQNELFHLGSDLCVPEADKAAMPVPRVEQRHVDALERDLDLFTAELPPLENFILPGGAAGAAALHLARTICRRAERRIATLARDGDVSAHVLAYVNRLSDALFVMARYENLEAGVDEPLWRPGE